MRALLYVLAALLALPAAAHAQLRVGPGETYTTIAAAAAASSDGDTIEITAGTYHEEVVFSRNDLVIRASGGDVIVDMTGMPLGNQGGKGIFILDGTNVTVEGITFVGATTGDGNGAGIRWQGGGTMTVRGCTFRGNEDGILGGNHGDNVAVIENNEFVGNGLGDFGYTHNLYINEIDTLTFRGNWSHALADGPDIGHLFKSRAHRNYVLYNRLTAEGSHSSYELQLPEGGVAYVIGNLIQQSSMGPNRTIVSIGGDGMQWPSPHIFIVNNTLVNDDGSGAFIQASDLTIPLEIVNNLFIGAGGNISGGMVVRDEGNRTGSTTDLVDAAAYDYHLPATSVGVNVGVDPGSDGAMSLAPTEQYVHPRGTAPRSSVGVIDVGAYEYGSVAMPDGGVGTDAGPGVDAGPGTDAGPRDGGGTSGDGSTTTDGGTGGSSGGCCGVAGARGTTGGALTSLCVLGALALRRYSRRSGCSRTMRA